MGVFDLGIDCMILASSGRKWYSSRVWFHWSCGLRRWLTVIFPDKALGERGLNRFDLGNH